MNRAHIDRCGDSGLLDDRIAGVAEVGFAGQESGMRRIGKSDCRRFGRCEDAAMDPVEQILERQYGRLGKSEELNHFL